MFLLHSFISSSLDFENFSSDLLEHGVKRRDKRLTPSTKQKEGPEVNCLLHFTDGTLLCVFG